MTGAASGTSLFPACDASILVSPDIDESPIFMGSGPHFDAAVESAWDKACVSIGQPGHACGPGGADGWTATLSSDTADAGPTQVEVLLILDPVPKQFDATARAATVAEACERAYASACRAADAEPGCIEDGTAVGGVVDRRGATQVLRATNDAPAVLHGGSR